MEAFFIAGRNKWRKRHSQVEKGKNRLILSTSALSKAGLSVRNPGARAYSEREA